MAYFPDLSLYDYVARPYEDCTADFNVGWLAPEHAFPLGPSSQRLIHALLRCALRPVRLCGGLHHCELGCAIPAGYGSLTVEYHGRAVELGNGEVRVPGPDGGYYTAPTLVAHYVAVHGYVPPAPFVDAVERRAYGVHVLSASRYERLRALSHEERFALCVDALQTFREQHPTDPIMDALSPIIARECAAESSSTADVDRRDMLRLHDLFDAAKRDDPLADAARHMSMLCGCVRGRFMPSDELLLRLGVTVLERIHEAGLVQWRAEWTPSLWDGTS